jgi:hypothetical protein
VDNSVSAIYVGSFGPLVKEHYEAIMDAVERTIRNARTSAHPILASHH